MAKDIYQVEIGSPRAWKIDSALINFGDHNQQLLATGLNLTYNRQSTQYFPINDDSRVIVTGTPIGGLTISAIVGPYGDLKEFVDAFSDVCNISSNVITVTPGGIQACEDSNYQNVKFVLGGCLLNGVSMNISNNNGLALISSNFTLEFLSLEIKNTK